jgi:hypothetical protein
VPTLFGRNFTRSQLQTYVADPRQIAQVQRATLREGRAEGVDVVRVVTGSGFEFMVVPGRGLDIVSASYNGIPLGWRALPGEVNAAFFEPEDMGWMRGYVGGLLTTGGLTYMGSPSIDNGESLGIHGRISYVPASNVWADTSWDGDCYKLWVRGHVTEAAALGPNLVMTREISTEMGANSFTIRDTVENRTFDTTPHMMLYHFNIGFPVLSESSILLADSEKIVGRDAVSNESIDNWNRFDAPQAGRDHHLFYHTLKPDTDGRTHVALVGMQVQEPLGIYLSYKHDTLPWLANWKCLQFGNYVTGIEPCNAWVEGRATEREAGRLRFLGPWESVSYEVEFGVLVGKQAIQAFVSEHRLPDPEL